MNESTGSHLWFSPFRKQGSRFRLRAAALGGVTLSLLSAMNCKKSDDAESDSWHGARASASGAAAAAARANQSAHAATGRGPSGADSSAVSAASARVVASAGAAASAAGGAASVGAAASAGGAASAGAAAGGERALAGAKVTIPAGSLVVGTTCGEQPRLPSEEASGTPIEMAEFDIDAYPYPNDPTKPPMTGVSQSQARDLCAAQGRRLCTELEWERACRGPANTRYEYGDKFDAKACPAGTLAPSAPGTAPTCKSAFGVYAMHGFVAEWTSSSWNRPETVADAGASAAPAALAGEDAEAHTVAVVQRGGTGNAPYAHMRCSASKRADPEKKGRSVGFRCCGGSENPATYPMPLETAPAAFEPVQNPPDKLVTRVRNAMRNGGFKDAPGTQGNVRSLWQWRPVPNEEIFAVVYESVSADGTKSSQPLAVQLCEKTAQLLARIKSPVDDVSAPTPDPSFGRIQFAAKRGDEAGTVGFEYKFGAVVISQPDWLSGSSKGPKPAK